MVGNFTARRLLGWPALDQQWPPRAGVVIAAGSPAWTMELILGSGHMLPAEKPQELAGLVVGFLREAATA